jgi:hypothetical protein
MVGLRFRVLRCTAKSTVASPNLFLEPRSQYNHNFSKLLTVLSKENYALNRTILLMHSNVSFLCRRPIAALWGVRSDENSYPYKHQFFQVSAPIIVSVESSHAMLSSSTSERCKSQIVHINKVVIICYCAGLGEPAPALAPR